MDCCVTSRTTATSRNRRSHSRRCSGSHRRTSKRMNTQSESFILEQIVARSLSFIAPAAGSKQPAVGFKAALRFLWEDSVARLPIPVSFMVRAQAITGFRCNHPFVRPVLKTRSSIYYYMYKALRSFIRFYVSAERQHFSSRTQTARKTRT